jgi:hypothetical protein
LITRDNREENCLCKTPQFERCLDDLRKKGGTALAAAERSKEIFRNLMQTADRPEREQFRYTRKGEYRIRHCKKISLGCGYRLVFIQKNGCYVFLYADSHDDFFRWLERNKGLTYEVDWAANSMIIVQDAHNDADELPEDVLEEKIFIERYEKKLLEQLDDDLLARIFPGWCKNYQD